MTSVTTICLADDACYGGHLCLVRRKSPVSSDRHKRHDCHIGTHHQTHAPSPEAENPGPRQACREGSTYHLEIEDEAGKRVLFKLTELTRPYCWPIALTASWPMKRRNWSPGLQRHRLL